VGKVQGALFDLVEIDQVEVLRGPQGTLWGRNTLAGAFNIVTRKPSGEASGSASLHFGNYSSRGGKLSIDLPTIGIAKVNLARRSQAARRLGREHGRQPAGPAGRKASTEDLNNVDSKSARLAIDLDPSDSFSIAYRGDYNDIDQNPSHSQLYRALLPFMASYVSTKRDERTTVDGPSFERSKTQGHSLTLEWDINDANTLKSITAKRVAHLGRRPRPRRLAAQHRAHPAPVRLRLFLAGIAVGRLERGPVVRRRPLLLRG
jgi:iron complex outermembrane receptor protein